MTMARSMLQHSGCDVDHWGFAVRSATHIRNRMPTKGNPNRLSAYQMETGKAPDLSKLVPFGTVGYAHQLYPQHPCPPPPMRRPVSAETTSSGNRDPSLSDAESSDALGP